MTTRELQELEGGEHRDLRGVERPADERLASYVAEALMPLREASRLAEKEGVDYVLPAFGVAISELNDAAAMLAERRGRS